MVFLVHADEHDQRVQQYVHMQLEFMFGNAFESASSAGILPVPAIVKGGFQTSHLSRFRQMSVQLQADSM